MCSFGPSPNIARLGHVGDRLAGSGGLVGGDRRDLGRGADAVLQKHPMQCSNIVIQ